MIRYAALFIMMISTFCYAEESKPYMFEDLNFSIQCPNGYEAKKMAGAFQNTVGIVLTSGSDKKDFKPNITISSAPNSTPPIDLDSFYNLNLRNFLKDANFRLISSARTKLGDRDAYELVYKQNAALKDNKNAVVQLNIMQLYLIDPSKVYVINYSAAEKDYHDYLTLADEIIKSFKIVEKKSAAVKKNNKIPEIPDLGY